jgi:hypothetical protein
MIKGRKYIKNSSRYAEKAQGVGEQALGRVTGTSQNRLISKGSNYIKNSSRYAEQGQTNTCEALGCVTGAWQVTAHFAKVFAKV